MKKKLSKDAYGGINGRDYTPYITDKANLKESSLSTLLIGVLIAVIFAASNTYGGMVSGITVAAGIPGAIIGATVLRAISRNSSILNTNITAGMASGGESIASGLIYVFPAIILVAGVESANFLDGVFAGVAGAFIGISVTSIVHNYLIVEQHGLLRYPEAMAISETMVTSENGGEALKFMGIGAAIAGIFTLISSQITGLVSTTVSYVGSSFKWQWTTDVNPLLAGIGFIIGLNVAVGMFAGSVMDNFVLVPLISYFASFADSSVMVWNDPTTPLNSISPADVHGIYTKYIGAGMMLSGGILSAIKLLPIIKSSLADTFSKNENSEKSSDGLARYTLILLVVGILLGLIGAFTFTSGIVMWLVGIILVLFFSFIFAIVAANMTGTVGTSNLPVSGMTIASILIITLIFLAMGWVSQEDNISILLLATIVVTAISISGGYAQSQKTTYIIGGSKHEMQKYFTIATVIGVITVVSCIFLLAPQIESGLIDPPQAGLMATLTQGVLTKNLPWTIILVGIFLGIFLDLLKLPIMTIAIGLYLPMGTVTIILFGALIRVAIEYMNKKDDKNLEKRVDRGIVLSAGLVAGGALTGLLGAGLAAAFGGDITSAPFYSSQVDGFIHSNTMALLLLVVLIVVVYLIIGHTKLKDQDHE